MFINRVVWVIVNRGEGGIRTLDSAYAEHQFSRLAHSTTLPLLRNYNLTKIANMPASYNSRKIPKY